MSLQFHSTDYIYIGLFIITVILCWYLYHQSKEQFKFIQNEIRKGNPAIIGTRHTNTKVQENFQTATKVEEKPSLCSDSKEPSKEGFDSMAGMRATLSTIGTAPVDLNEKQTKRYNDLKKRCEGLREKCYIVGNITNCNYQYEGCLQDSLWDAKINTENAYVQPILKD